MDPDACLKELVGLLQSSSDEYENALELLNSLVGWLNRGGFDPKPTVGGVSWVDVLTGALMFLEELDGERDADEDFILEQIRELVPETVVELDDAELWTMQMLQRLKGIAVNS